MSIRTVLVALLALVCGGSAVVGINTLRSQGTEPTKVDTVTVFVAAAEIPRGKTISAELLGTKDYPKELVPDGAVLAKEEIMERVVSIPMVKDEPIVEAKLASRNAKGGAASLIPDGKRAYTITTTMSSAVAGLIRPGDKVDVLLSMSSGTASDETGGATTSALLQNVEIFAIEHHIEAQTDAGKGDPNIRTVTLLVSPDEANEVQLAQNKGTLSLTLRGSNDSKVAIPETATLNKIMKIQKKPTEPEISPAKLIPEGMRACTITATVSTAVAGLLVPGNHVDVLCTTTNDLIKTRTGGSSTKTLLENIGILAVDQRTADSKLDSNVRTVTLLVTPDDAGKVALAQTTGTLHLTLRGPNDIKSKNPKLAVFSDLSGAHEEEQSDPPATAVVNTTPVATTTIRTIRGTSEGEVSVQSPAPLSKRP